MSSNLAFRKQIEGVKVGGLNIPDNTILLSLKLLNKLYFGDCLRLRRSSDDAESDFGFDSIGDIDTSAISTWGTTDTLYVVTWYDQSGFGNDSGQSTDANQPTWDNTNKKIVFTSANSNYLTILDNNSIDVGTSDFSYVSNANFTTLPSDLHIFNKGTFSVPRTYIRIYYYLGSLKFATEDNVAPEENAEFATVSTGIDYNLIGIKEGTDIKSYTNGTLNNTIPLGGSYDSLTTPVDLTIGSQVGIGYLDGLMTDFMLFKKALNINEITLIQNVSTSNSSNVTKTKKDCYDIFTENGHLAKSDGLDSQLLASLFVDSRADDSEQPIKELQRGWAGNIIVNSNIPDYEIGCKQWIYTEQGKTTTEVAEAILDTVKNDGVQWMIDDGLCQDVEVSIFDLDFKLGKIVLDFVFKIDENNIEQRRIVLWNNIELL